MSSVRAREPSAVLKYSLTTVYRRQPDCYTRYVDERADSQMSGVGLLQARVALQHDVSNAGHLNVMW